jgi:hypothetical protein
MDDRKEADIEQISIYWWNFGDKTVYRGLYGKEYKINWR